MHLNLIVTISKNKLQTLTLGDEGKFLAPSNIESWFLSNRNCCLLLLKFSGFSPSHIYIREKKGGFDLIYTDIVINLLFIFYCSGCEVIAYIIKEK